MESPDKGVHEDNSEAEGANGSVGPWEASGANSAEAENPGLSKENSMVDNTGSTVLKAMN